MLNLTRAIDRATGYVFVPPADDDAPGTAGSARPNAHALLSSAMGPPRPGVRGDVRDVQERWVDAREAWDAFESAQWRREGEALRSAVREAGVAPGDLRVRERSGP